MFQYTAARRRLESAHRRQWHQQYRFNTQPPEGGWSILTSGFTSKYRFNTQPPEGGWVLMHWDSLSLSLFQHTAARRRLDQT